MQTFSIITSDTTLSASLAKLLNNDRTALSCSSGTAFPTANLEVGMFCLRTDQFKLYQLKDTTPTWVLIADLNTSAGIAAITGLASANPAAPGTAAPGTSTTVARADHIHPLQTSVSGNAGTATKLATARTVTFTGGATGSFSFDGSADVANVALALAGKAPTAGTADTANALATGGNYQGNSLGVGTAPSNVAGEIRASGNITGYYSSDARLKTNVRPISDAVERIGKIDGVFFDWTDEFIGQHGGEDDYFLRKSDVGVIAQDVQKVLPEVVAQRADGHLAVKYDRLVALLIAGVKEQQAQIAGLEGRITALEGK